MERLLPPHRGKGTSVRAAGVVCLVLHQQCGWRYYSDEEYGDEKTHMLIVGRLYRYDDRLNEL